MFVELIISFSLILILIILSPSLKLMNILTILNSIINFSYFIYVLSINPGTFSNVYLSSFFLVDNLTLYGILLVSFVFLLASLYAVGYVSHLVISGDLHKENLKIFYSAFNLLIGFTILTFSANNLALFLVFAEITTFISSILIVSLNIRDNIDAAIKYIFVTSVAMIFTFIGLVFLLAITKLKGNETLNWSELIIMGPNLNSSLTTLAFLFIFLGFIAKSGIAPLHTWLPHAYSSAPSVVASILSSAVSYIGLFGIIRIFAIAHETSSWPVISGVLVSFGILSMFIGSFSMLQQRNLKKLIAFSSSEQMGFMLIAISLGSQTIIYWLLFYLLIHALIKALLFFSAGIFHRQYRSNEYDSMFNALNLQPLAVIGLIIGSIAILGIPPFGLFLPKFMMLYQLILAEPLALVMVILFLFVIAISGFTVFDTKLISNQLVHEFDSIKPFETPKLMQLPIVVLIFIILIAGLLLPIELQNYLNSIIKILRI